MATVELLEDDTAPATTDLSAPRRRLRVPGALATVLPLLAAVLAVAASFWPMFRSVTTMQTTSSGSVVRTTMVFSFDGWGRPMTPHSADSLGFPFAGRGPEFGLLLSVCAVAVLLAILLTRYGTMSRTRRWGDRLGLAAGAALFAVAGSMWLTVDPGTSRTTMATTVTTVGACVFVSAAAGVLAVAGAVVGDGRDSPPGRHHAGASGR